jgi:putative N6-adenine-specific DNA methylase
MVKFEYQKTHRYFAQTPGGVEDLSADELKILGAKDIETGIRGVRFTADRAVLYGINYKARLISRVLAPLVTFHCRDREDLYRAGLSVAWTSIFTPDDTFGIFSNVSHNEALRHSKFASLCLKDAVADYFRDKSGRRPDVDPKNPRVWLNLHIDKEQGTISLDCSGGSLHRRGYRKKTVEAPMQEVLAAAIVELSGWKGERPLHDPMCGSGTLLSEALIKVCRIPAGFLKDKFGFCYLPDFEKEIWETVKKQTDGDMQELPEGLIAGSDMDAKAYDAVAANLAAIPGGDAIRISRKGFDDLSGLENRAILCNPPYGIRMRSTEDLGLFYKRFGDFLKHKCKGSAAYIYFGNREMIKHIGLKPSWKKPLRNAGLDGRLVKYEMY